MSKSEKNILTAQVLAGLIGEKNFGRALTILTSIYSDDIVYGPGSQLHKYLALETRLTVAEIGFAGRVSGYIDKQIMLTPGGNSLENYSTTQAEKDRAFQLVQAMLVECGGELIWDKTPNW